MCGIMARVHFGICTLENDDASTLRHLCCEELCCEYSMSSALRGMMMQVHQCFCTVRSYVASTPWHLHSGEWWYKYTNASVLWGIMSRVLRGICTQGWWCKYTKASVLWGIMAQVHSGIFTPGNDDVSTPRHLHSREECKGEHSIRSYKRFVSQSRAWEVGEPHCSLNLPHWPSYLQFPPTPCFVHRIDAVPPVFRDCTLYSVRSIVSDPVYSSSVLYKYI